MKAPGASSPGWNLSPGPRLIYFLGLQDELTLESKASDLEIKKVSGMSFSNQFSSSKYNLPEIQVRQRLHIVEIRELIYYLIRISKEGL